MLTSSLFFRVFERIMDFIARVAKGSFVVSFFTADYDNRKLSGSVFAGFFNFILNKIPKPLRNPGALPKELADFINGSVICRTLSDVTGTTAAGTPVTGKRPVNAVNERPGVLSAVRWLCRALPVWLLLGVTVAAPLMGIWALLGVTSAPAAGNSMPLAIALAVTFVFVWLSRKFPIDLPAVFLLLFAVVQIFAAVTSFRVGSSLRIAMITVVFMTAFLIVRACVVSRRQIDVFFFVFIASALVAGLIGMYQYAYKIVDQTWIDVDLMGAIQFRMFSSFGNPNVYGTYLLLLIPLCAAMVLYVKNIFLKICAAGTTGLLLFNWLMTYSRGCYLALAVAAVMFVMLFGKKVMVFVTAGVVTLPITFPLMLPLLPANIANRILSITNLADSSTSYRLQIWQGTLRILKDFWFMGLGQGIDAYNAVYPFYGLNAVVAPHAHNIFLQVFVEMGIMGLLVFLGFLAAFFRTMAVYMRWEKEWRNKMVAMAMTAAVVGFLFQGIFDYVFYNYRVMLIFYLYIGMACAFAGINLKRLRENGRANV